ncbi:MAG: tRNA (adenosine(37)-N6)-dimethylallyltransferase MiaA [Lachnospiraceae bacterium]|nr:tRNA (adenosine(37)-N6)-dimethylallyltransferase MiaA [Lachnospiraceae bacterium]
MEKRPLLILTGPTAAGKTALSISLARRFDGEIISADSMQVYRGMDIGSAKIRPAEMQGVPHHLIDIREPEEGFSVADFVECGREAAAEIHARGHLPILVGGTGFYIQAFLKDLVFAEGEEDKAVRERLTKLAETEGPEALHQRLKELDPASAEAIHANNVKRVIRALEYYELTGRRISETNTKQQESESPYNYLYFVLDLPREELYARIEKRVDQMMAEGLPEEVKHLKDRGLTQKDLSMQGLGYRQLLDHLDGLCSREEAVARIKTETRHFAKRQLTWFRREKDVIWVNKNDFPDEEAILQYMSGLIRERLFLP